MNYRLIVDFGDAVIGGHANFRIERKHAFGSDIVLLRDLGPWDRHPTITNDAQWVMQTVAYMLVAPRKRLLYYDSAGELTELLLEGEDGEPLRLKGFGFPPEAAQ